MYMDLPVQEVLIGIGGIPSGLLIDTDNCSNSENFRV